MPNSSNWIQTLAKHDTAIEHLGSEVRTLKSEVHQGFSAINTALIGLGSKFDKMDAAPKFDMGRTLAVVKDLFVLFAMTVAGILYVAGNQNATTLAKQEMLNNTRTQQIEQINRRLEVLEPWRATVTKKD